MSRLLRYFVIMVVTLGSTIFSLNCSAYSRSGKFSAVGYWQTRDKKTNNPSGVVRVYYRKGMFYGKIIRIYRQNGHLPTDRCVKCTGANKNKRILGILTIRDMVYQNGVYRNGRVLDPNNGKEYHARMWVTDNGQQLKLRGYIGIPLFGRTAVWHRIPRNKV